jgi:hypothetical protein
MRFLKCNLQLLILLLGIASFASANNTCALNVGTAAHYTFSTTVASDWTSCGGTTPQAGDNITITGTAHTFTLDAAHTFGIGQAPYLAYPSSITGSATGGTCGSAPSLGGTSVNGNLSAAVGCQVVSGNCTPYLYQRGYYSATGTTAISSTCSGGTAAWTLNWQSGGGTPAILSGTGTQVIIAAAITARGDVLAVDSYGDTSTGLSFTNGGNLVFDFSLSAASTNLYSFGNEGNGGSWSRAYSSDGTCTTATCSISTTGSGVWRLSAGGANHGPILSFNHMALSNGGDSTEPWFYTVTNEGTYGGFTLKNSTVKKSSLAQIANVSGGSGETIDIENNQFANTVFSNLPLAGGFAQTNFNISFPTSADSATKVIINNSSDKALFQSSSLLGVTVKGNVIGGNVNAVTDYSTPWVADNNFFVGYSQSSSNSFNTPGDVTHSVFFNFDTTSNWHVLLDWQVARNTLEQYNIFGVAVANSGDSGEISQVPISSSYTMTFDNNIILPDPAAHSWSEPAGSAGTRAGYQITDHNYWYADYGASNPAFGFAQLDENGQSHTGVITSMRCNTLWNPVDSNSFVKIDDQLYTSTVSNPGTATGLDYNWGRGSSATQLNTCSGCTGQTNGYISAFSGIVPGAHDNNAIDPGVDYKRVIEAFASDYLHVTPSRGAWTSTTYAQGDTVSSAVSGFYWSKSLIYTCYALAGCSSAPQPGTSSSWYSYWEPYTLTWLKTNVPISTTLVDGALQVFGIGEDAACTTASPCDPITAVRHWIFAGHIPSTTQFVGACAMDGASIGPVDAKLNRKSIPAVAVN